MAETSNGQGERGITALFVRRPVLAFVINTLIAVAGMAAFYGCLLYTSDAADD